MTTGKNVDKFTKRDWLGRHRNYTCYIRGETQELALVDGETQGFTQTYLKIWNLQYAAKWVIYCGNRHATMKSRQSKSTLKEPLLPRVLNTLQFQTVGISSLAIRGTVQPK